MLRNFSVILAAQVPPTPPPPPSAPCRVTGCDLWESKGGLPRRSVVPDPSSREVVSVFFPCFVKQ